MIPYADLERAIARWRARQAGHETSSPFHEVSEESVVGESSYAAEPEAPVVEGSGLITIDQEEPTRH
jgi:hypothetical protein